MTDSIPSPPWEQDMPPSDEPVSVVREQSMGALMASGEFKPQEVGAPPWYQGKPPGGLLWYKDIQPILEDQSLVGGILGERGFSMIAGASGSTKTFFALHLALCVASGVDFFDRPVKKGGSIYIAAEAGDSIKNRIYAWRLQHPEAPLDIPFAVITWPVNFYADQPVGNIMYVASLIEEVIKKGIPIRQITIDTMSRATPGADENSSQDMTAFINNMDMLRAITTAAVTLVHHHGKDKDRGARGHSSLYAAVDTEITVEHNKVTEIATAEVTKQRDLPTDGKIAYKLRVVELGQLDDGKAITSCIIEAVEGTAAAPKGPKLNAAARLGLDLLRKAISEAGKPSASDRIPKDARVVGVEVWRRYFYTGTASDDQTPESRKKAFQRLRDALQAAHAIELWADEVWVTASRDNRARY